MTRKTQRWAVGDVVAIPQSDGGHTPCVIVDHIMANVVGVALYLQRLGDDRRAPGLQGLTPVSVVLTTRDLLDGGSWEVVGNAEVEVPMAMRPYEQFRANNWIGSKTYGSGIVGQFLDACFGLSPWDDWADPNYLDQLLLDPSVRPPGIVLLS